jgi:DNA polymerase I
MAMAEQLFLIDGNSLVYRAFFALPESIATSDGRPTNAIFGFASMLVKIITDYGISPTVVVWDAGSSGRKEVYADYKAQRIERPSLLGEQWPAFEPLVEAFGYRNIRVDGYEADDVIASLVEQAKAADLGVMVVTGDRDAYQLVDDGRVKIMTTSRGITDTRVYDREGVIERYGIPPELIPDFIGLKGDTSDNIPGVPGIGDKTAAQLLNQFGSLEGVLANVDAISGKKRQENLREHADDARVSKRLATMVRDIDIDLDVIAAAGQEPDRSRLREVFRDYELRDPLRRLEEALGSADAAAPPPVAETRLTAAVRPAPLPELAGDDEIAIAVRAPEIPEDQLFSEELPWRWAGFAGESEVLVGEAAAPGPVAESAGDRPVVAHDAKALQTVPRNLAHDTEVAAYLLDPARRGYPLEELAQDHGLGADVDDPVASDALIICALAALQRERLHERGLDRLLNEVELPLVHVLREMELAGVKLDCDLLATISERVQGEVLELEHQIYALAGTEFHIGSPQQLAEVLFVKLGLSRKRRGKTGYSTDARVLQAIRGEHEIIPKIERYRELTKLAQTYLDALPALCDPRSRLHTTFNQVVATTGRLSSTDPNLQNIPIRTEVGREIRACFVAEEGHKLISADYSQVELRVLAHVADEPVLKEIFARGEDVHAATAAQVLGADPVTLSPGDRSKAKMINFGIVYGLTGFGLADRLQIPQEEAQEFIDRYLERFPAVRAYIDQTVAFATTEGYVTTLFGRRRQIPELKARNRQVRSLGERLAVNTPIQGSAADIIKVAMVRAHDALREAGLGTKLILQIHDELLFEAPVEEVDAAKEIVVCEMEGAFPLDPPLAVDVGVGANWLDAK